MRGEAPRFLVKELHYNNCTVIKELVGYSVDCVAIGQTLQTLFIS